MKKDEADASSQIDYDVDRIDIEDELCVTYWAERFDVTPAELRTAIDQFGPDAARLARLFGLADR